METTTGGPASRLDSRGGGEEHVNTDGGAQKDVIAPPPGELFSKTNNSVAILLTNGTTRVLSDSDTKARE